MEKTCTILCILIICCGCLSSQETVQEEEREIPQGGYGGRKPPGNMTPDMRPPGNMTHGMRGLGLDMTEHDLDGDGLLSEEEMIAAREAMMDNPRFIERIDSDGDGILNEEEKNKKPTQ
ncbi:MAG: EF-hand domain-containing protein [Candidatus Altiarchaeota archaeon]|nr:EF-hand domain-containing protein [Candidatus Altiarchaeota archaeon]